MEIQLKQPISFSELGQRDNNEDFVFPLESSTGSKSKLFLVCDGMGGLDKGEIASEVVANTIYKDLINKTEFDEISINEACVKAHNALEQELSQDPLINRMGSTLTLLAFDSKGATVAHIGDSRVYHIRNDKILYKTRDHKQVLNMVEDGIITKEQAETHPWRNKLSRSISVKRYSTDENKIVKYDLPEVKFIKNIEVDDYFFLCTDGVLEQLDELKLCELLSLKNTDNQAKMNEIYSICKSNTRDNFSGYIVQIDNILSKNNPNQTS